MKGAKSSKKLNAEQRDKLLSVLKARFQKNPVRPTGLEWERIAAKLESSPGKLWSLSEMERTGGEPDVVAIDPDTGEFVFWDCAAESPAGRTSLCYDREALDARKKFKPKDCATDLAAAMGSELLTEDEYHQLQKRGSFDTRSSSWLKTPSGVRALGGAIYGSRRFGRVFIDANGADAYFGGRGFRSSLRV
jgi:hypothetical protein